MIPTPMPAPTPEGSRPHQPWSASGCSFPGCGIEQTETLSNLGRRCKAHPPQFDPDYAIELMRAGFPDAAGAYLRTEFGGGT